MRRTLLGSELMVSFRELKGASSLGDSRGCVTVNARDSSSRELGRALQDQYISSNSTRWLAVLIGGSQNG